jgi:uracil-DNA glycosylase
MRQVRACSVCADLPLGPLPILKAAPEAKILIAGQAPGRKTHAKGLPFDDVSGDRLREWIGIDRETFYGDPRLAVIPMGFCYPGTGKGGDLPPRPECAQTWRTAILGRLDQLELTVVIGRYAIDWHLPDYAGKPVVEAARAWRQHWPHTLVLPHPSPRNNRWLRQNAWFEGEVVPLLRQRVGSILRP